MSQPPQPPPTDGPPPGPDGAAGAHPTGTVVVPAWLSGDWWFAARTAGLGHALLLLAGVAITLLHVLRQIAIGGLDSVEWGHTLLVPLFVVLGWAGGGAGTPVLLTAAVYLLIAYLLVCRRSAEVARIVADPVRAFAAAVKVGVVAALGLLVIGILVNSLAEDTLATAFSPNLGDRVDLTSLVFTSLIVGSLAAILAFVVAGRTSIAALLGLTIDAPGFVRSGAVGGRRTLLVGGLGLLILATLGSVLDALTQSGTTFGSVVATLLSRMIDVALRGIDSALLLLLGTTKFLHDGGFVWTGPGSIPGWMWLSLPTLVGAYLAGGLAAARHSAPRSRAEAAKGALLVGPTVAIVTLLVAIGWAGQPFIDDLVPIALLLPSLWGVIAVIGAWLWANQRGLPSGLVLERPDLGPPDPDPAGTGPAGPDRAADDPAGPDRAADAPGHAEPDPPEPDVDEPVAEPTAPPVPPRLPQRNQPPVREAPTTDERSAAATEPLPDASEETTTPLDEARHSAPPTDQGQHRQPLQWPPDDARTDAADQHVSDDELRRFAPPDPGTRKLPEE